MCFIYITNGPLDSKKNMKHMNKIKYAKVLSRKQGSLAKFGIIDGLCQYEILNEYGFKEEQLPHFAVFSGRSNQGTSVSGEIS